MSVNKSKVRSTLDCSLLTPYATRRGSPSLPAHSLTPYTTRRGSPSLPAHSLRHPERLTLSPCSLPTPPGEARPLSLLTPYTTRRGSPSLPAHSLTPYTTRRGSPSLPAHSLRHPERLTLSPCSLPTPPGEARPLSLLTPYTTRRGSPSLPACCLPCWTPSDESLTVLASACSSDLPNCAKTCAWVNGGGGGGTIGCVCVWGGMLTYDNSA